MAYKDVNGRTGYIKMTGTSGKTYGDLRLFSEDELDAVLADGITKWSRPPRPVKAMTLERAKHEKKQELIGYYTAESEAAVTSQTFEWNGGYSSAVALHNAVQLAELKTSTDVILYDINNQPQTLTIADAKQVVIDIADAFYLIYAKKQGLFVQVDEATTIGQVRQIKWDAPA